jgi:hypothetical protein
MISSTVNVVCWYFVSVSASPFSWIDAVEAAASHRGRINECIIRFFIQLEGFQHFKESNARVVQYYTILKEIASNE